MKKKPVIKLGQLLQCFSQEVIVDSLNLNSTSLFNFTWSSDSTARITVRPILMITNKVDSYVYIDVCLWIVCPYFEISSSLTLCMSVEWKLHKALAKPALLEPLQLAFKLENTKVINNRVHSYKQSRALC